MTVGQTVSAVGERTDRQTDRFADLLYRRVHTSYLTPDEDTFSNTDVFRATVNFEEFFGGLKDANDFLEAVNSQQNSCFLDAKISTFSCYRSF